MINNQLFSFSSSLDGISVPSEINNPFSSDFPKIVEIAVKELQSYLINNDQKWIHNFGINDCKTNSAKGKMFGVLVVRLASNDLAFIATFSGTMEDEPHPDIFIPSLFNISTNDYFMNKGMKKLSIIGEEIERLKIDSDENILQIQKLKQERKVLSKNLQQELFDQYIFKSMGGKEKNLCDIFQDFHQKRPPSGAGECAAPKLFQYAYKHGMKPIAITEFWWGVSPKSEKRVHLEHYPSCEDKCRPILSFMLSL